MKNLNVRLFTDYPICNYSCSYCISGHGNNDWIPREPDLENYMPIIQRIVELPYKINIRIGVSGEFFLSKKLIEGARYLSNQENIESVNLISNLSFSEKQYEKCFEGFDMNKVAMVASYHPTEVKDKEKWLKTAIWMNNKIKLSICLIVHPQILPSITKIKNIFNDNGIQVFLQGFIGIFNGKEYPQSYTQEELEIIKKNVYSRHDYEFLVLRKKPKLCNAGHKSIYIDMLGRVLICGGRIVDVEPLGNILKDKDLKLYDRPKLCTAEDCLCNTDNINTVVFEEKYERYGVHQHQYNYNLEDDEWDYSKPYM